MAIEKTRRASCLTPVEILACKKLTDKRGHPGYIICATSLLMILPSVYLSHLNRQGSKYKLDADDLSFKTGLL
jgi:hypothetical protein